MVCELEQRDAPAWHCSQEIDVYHANRRHGTVSSSSVRAGENKRVELILIYLTQPAMSKRPFRQHLIIDEIFYIFFSDVIHIRGVFQAYKKMWTQASLIAKAQHCVLVVVVVLQVSVDTDRAISCVHLRLPTLAIMGITDGS